MRRGIKVLKQAAGIAAREAKKGEISPTCAAPVAMDSVTPRRAPTLDSTPGDVPSSRSSCTAGPSPRRCRYGDVIEPAAHLVNPPHRLAVGREQQDGAVVDHDLHVALVVLDV